MRNSASSPRPSSIARAAALTISASAILDMLVTNGGVPDTKGREPVRLASRPTMDRSTRQPNSRAPDRFRRSPSSPVHPTQKHLVFSQSGRRSIEPLGLREWSAGQSFAGVLTAESPSSMPVDDVAEGEVEVQIRSVQSATPRPPDLVDVIASLPVGRRRY
jgi:hypothetical protein